MTTAFSTEVDASKENVLADDARVFFVKRVATRNFRNLISTDVELSSSFNVFHGENGAGKTSFLEAVYYLLGLRSFRGAKTADMVRAETEEATIKMVVDSEPAPRVIGAKLNLCRGRKIELDGKRLSSISRYLNSSPAVVFHAGDLTLVSGSPDGRRSFLDRMLAQIDAAHSLRLKEYTKALRSRNKLFKAENLSREDVRSFDHIIAERGAEIGQARAALVEEVSVATESAFARVIGDDLSFTLRYQPRVKSDREAIYQALADAFVKDRARGFTADGPHADELSFAMKSRAAKHQASQGQQRSMVLALKVAELETLKKRTGIVPVLLLDDVSSELDRKRNKRFFDVLSELRTQVLLTTTHPEFILSSQERSDFEVKDGEISRI